MSDKQAGTGEGLWARTRRGLPNNVTSGPRNRSRGLILLAAILTLGTGLVVAALVLNAGEREQVLAISKEAGPVAKGQVIQRDDLASRSVAGVDGSIPVANLDDLVGMTATVDLLPGQVITDEMVTETPLPGEGESVIGLSLDPNRVPGDGLSSGDTVDVIAIPGDVNDPEAAAALDDPEVLTAGAVVYGTSGEAVAGGQVLVTLVVDATDARRVAAYSTQNRVALVEVVAAGSGPREK